MYKISIDDIENEKNKTYHYKSYNDDFVESKNQNYKLKENYILKLNCARKKQEKNVVKHAK